MTWKYKIVKYFDDNCWALHEIYYDDDGNPTLMSEDPVKFISDVSVEDLIKSLEMALNAAKNDEIFEEPEEWL